MEKCTIKIENLFSAIVRTRDYDHFSASYDNNLKAQKDFLKKILIPKITEALNTLASSQDNYNPIKVGKITSKYTSNIKTLSIELIYSADEYIDYIHHILADFKRAADNAFILKWNLYVL